MVVTRAQDASLGGQGGQPLPAEQREVNPPASVPLAPAPPLPVTARDEQLTALSQQIQMLTAMVNGLREQSVATQHQPAPPVPPAPLASQQSARGRSPRRETTRRRAPSKEARQEPHKRRHSPARDLGEHSPEPLRREEPKRRPPPPRSSPSSSSSTSEPVGREPAISRRAEERLDEYHRRLEELARKVNNQPEEEYDTRPPYTRRILEEPVPSRFRLPQLDPYEGTSDPLDHLESYKTLMQVQGATDALLCKCFPATLRKAARAWHSRLPPHSIDSFRGLERAFLAHFDACRRIPRVADSLFSVRQKEGESLRDFVSRFKAAALEVYHLDDAVATLALKRGLLPSRFTFSLDKKPPSSYSDLLLRAQKYIRADEADFTRRESARGSNRKPDRPAPNGSSRPRRTDPPHRSEHRRQSLAPVDRELTPLLAPRSHILMEIEGEPYLRRPPPMKKGPPATKAVTAASTGTMGMIRTTATA